MVARAPHHKRPATLPGLPEERAIIDVSTHLDRRGFLSGLLALATASALPLPASASLSAEAEAERVELIAHFQDRVLRADILEVGLKLLEGMRVPKRYTKGLTEALTGKDIHRGARSVRALDDDSEVKSALRALTDRAQRDLRLKRRLLKLSRAAPQDAVGQRALVEWVITEVAGLELQRIRDHVAAWPVPDSGEELVIVFGPVTNMGELGALFLTEPMALFHQLVHGRRARIIYPDSPRSYRRDVLAALLDPGARVVVFQGHGYWHGFSLQGSYAHPDKALSSLMRKAKDSPVDLAEKLSGRITGLGIWSGFDRGTLEEEELAELVAQLHPDAASREAILKDRIVRYTCGTERYRMPGALIWDAIPESIVEKMYLKPDGFSVESPDDQGAWEPELVAWLEGKDILVEERAAFGACLVRSPADTRGYIGRSWLDHFVADPLPEPLPGSPFPSAPPAAAELPPDEAPPEP